MVKASPFYALLRMDGDHIGKELQEGNGERVSAALTGCTSDAAEILSSHYGLPIYVGCDNVLALLPLQKAPPAAGALRCVFVKHMGENSCETPALSAGMVFAQYSKPLGTVLDLSKDLLGVWGDVLPIGGWDSRSKTRGPLPLRAFLPGGSYWFLRVPPDGLDRLPPFLGDAADFAHGFGHYALGTYQFDGE